MRLNIFGTILLLLATLLSCTSGTQKTGKRVSTADSLKIEKDKEAREDALKYAKADSIKNTFTNSVTADYETPPVQSNHGADAADDPAIWINSKDASKSLIIGTNKKAGLHVYDLHGNEKQFIKVGKINNAEAGYNLKFKGESIDYIAGTNRTTHTVDVYKLNRDSLLLDAKPLCTMYSHVDDVYGFCTFYDKEKQIHYLFVNGKNGNIEQWQLKTDSTVIYGKLVRSFWVPSQCEGMVTDPVTNSLYVAVEDDAIYQFNALANADTTYTTIAGSSSTNNPAISYDIEGLTIYRESESKGYIIASIQGNFTYAVFDINAPHKYITTFTIQDGKYDGVEETDGIDMTSVNLGKEFPKGIFVVQDGFNKDNGIDVNQNFKIISAEKVLKFLE